MFFWDPVFSHLGRLPPLTPIGRCRAYGTYTHVALGEITPRQVKSGTGDKDTQKNSILETVLRAPGGKGHPLPSDVRARRALAQHVNTGSDDRFCGRPDPGPPPLFFDVPKES